MNMMITDRDWTSELESEGGRHEIVIPGRVPLDDKNSSFPYLPPKPMPALITEGNTRKPAAFRPSSRALGFCLSKLRRVALTLALIAAAEAALPGCGATINANRIKHRTQKRLHIATLSVIAGYEERTLSRLARNLSP